MRYIITALILAAALGGCVTYKQRALCDRICSSHGFRTMQCERSGLYENAVCVCESPDREIFTFTL